VGLFSTTDATQTGDHFAGSNNQPATFSISINKRSLDETVIPMPPAGVGLFVEAERQLPESDQSQFARRLVAEREAERQRLALDLHDGVNQLIAGAQIRLRRVEQMMPAAAPAVREVLARCGEMLVRALDENRRIVRNLRPADLEELGFARACRKFCEEVASRSGLRIKCRIARGSERWNQEVQLNLFRIVQEAIYNTKRYGCGKRVNLSLMVRNGWILLRIQDDGRGFRMAEVRSSKRRGQGVGLSGIRERAELLGGTCEIQSAPGKGTRITVGVPWRQGEQD
jgi:signal transduction histidine kinase